MARSRTPKFDASEVITNEIIRIIERGVLPWRKRACDYLIARSEAGRAGEDAQAA